MTSTGTLLWQAFTGLLGGIWAMLTTLFTAAMQLMAATSDAIWQGIITRITGLWMSFIGHTLRHLGANSNNCRSTAWTAMATLFTGFGGWIIDGLIGGITSKLGALRDTVVNAATSAAGWFKEKLGINSPSRVFTQYGGWISEGAALGIEGGQSAVRAAALAMAATAMAPMGAGAAEVGTAAGPLVGGGTPVAPRAVAAPAAAGGSSYTITIQRC